MLGRRNENALQIFISDLVTHNVKQGKHYWKPTPDTNYPHISLTKIKPSRNIWSCIFLSMMSTLKHLRTRINAMHVKTQICQFLGMRACTTTKLQDGICFGVVLPN